MQLVPVLDLMRGEVVRGIAGERDGYAPNQSRLTSSSDPVETCAALVETFAPEWIYIADLDGILLGDFQLDLLAALLRDDVRIAVDAGAASVETAQMLLETGIDRVIIGLETLGEMELLRELVAACGSEQITFSVDLREGRPVRSWEGLEYPEQIVSQAVTMGVEHFVVLDLVSVGVFQGVTTSSLCSWIKHRFPTTTIWTGGGVRSIEDVQELATIHVDGVMIASALHDGRITPSDWRNFVIADRASTSVWTDE